MDVTHSVPDETILSHFAVRACGVAEPVPIELNELFTVELLETMDGLVGGRGGAFHGFLELVELLDGRLRLVLLAPGRRLCLRVRELLGLSIKLRLQLVRRVLQALGANSLDGELLERHRRTPTSGAAMGPRTLQALRREA